jgi:hypothetical protein
MSMATAMSALRTSHFCWPHGARALEASFVNALFSKSFVEDAGSIGSGGNWNWRDTRFGLERLRPTALEAFEYQNVSATFDGLLVSYTRPIDAAWLSDPRNFTLRQWRYEATPQYGRPKLDDEAVEIVRCEPAADGRSVRIVAPAIKSGRVVHIRSNPTAASPARAFVAMPVRE